MHRSECQIGNGICAFIMLQHIVPHIFFLMHLGGNCYHDQSTCRTQVKFFSPLLHLRGDVLNYLPYQQKTPIY